MLQNISKHSAINSEKTHYYIGGIKIELDTQPDSNAQVHFTHDVVPNGAFTLDDDNTPALSNVTVLSGEVGSRYRVTLDQLPEHHLLESIVCDNDTVIIDLQQRQVLIDLEEPDITCTFTVVGKKYIHLF